MYRRTTIIHGLGWAALVMLVPALMLGCAVADGQRPKPAADSAPAVWYEDQQKKSAWPARDELAVFISRNAAGCATEADLAALLGPATAVCDRLAHGLIYKIPSLAASSGAELDRRIAILKAQACVSAVGMVYYSGAQRDRSTRLIHTDELIVRLRPSIEPARIARLEADFGLTLKMKLRFAPDTMLFTVRSPRVLLETANLLHAEQGVLYAYPNWLRSRVTK